MLILSVQEAIKTVKIESENQMGDLAPMTLTCMYINLSTLILILNDYLNQKVGDEGGKLNTLKKQVISEYNMQRPHILFIRLRDDLNRFYIDKRAGPIYLHRKGESDFRQVVSIYGNLINANLLTDSTPGAKGSEPTKQFIQEDNDKIHPTNESLVKLINSLFFLNLSTRLGSKISKLPFSKLFTFFRSKSKPIVFTPLLADAIWETRPK